MAQRSRLTITLAVIASLLWIGRAQTTTTTTTITPIAFATTSGATVGTVAGLDQFDEFGIAIDPNRLVQFRAKTAATTYNGTQSFKLPSSISPAAITAIQVLVNYRGPIRSTQTWTWQIFDWINRGYVTIGDNFFAPNSTPWTILNFNVGGNNLANYVRSSDRLIVLRLLSNNIAGDAVVDYEALTITSTSTPIPQGRALYVSTIGNDSNPGTIAAPFKTISHAASIATPGATVYVRGGIYRERVVVNVSGSAAGGFIQFQSFPGETAVLDGTGVAMPPVLTTPIGLLQITNRSYVIVSGLEIRNWMANSGSFFPAGISITGAGSHLELRHNRIHAIVNPTGTCGGNPANCGAHGLAIYGTNGSSSLSSLVIDGNELFGLTLGQSESMALNGNVASWMVTNNIVHDNNNIGIDAVGFEGTSPTVATDRARSGLISGNLVYNINDSNNPAYPKGDNSAGGIYVDGGTQITIERNISRNNNIGIELASEHSGRATSLVVAGSNLIYSNTGPGFSIGGFNSGAGSTDHCTIINNTLSNNDSTPNDGSGELQIQFFPNDGTVSHNVFANNILFANSQGVLITNPFTHPQVSLDFNLYFAPNGDPNGNDWQFNNITFSTFASYRTATGQDAHSMFANPRFLSVTVPQLFVAPTSPAINAGTNPGVAIVGTMDQAGFARVRGAGIDIGAYEQ